MNFRYLSARKIETAVFILFSIWFLVILTSPFLVPSDTVNDLSGFVGQIDNAEIVERMNPLPRIIYTIGDIYCHQKSDRSYFINGNQMPFCARDFGIFAGLTLGMLIALLAPKIRINAITFVLMFIPLVIDGALQLLTSYESTNPLRLFTGILAGIAVAMLLSSLIREIFADQRKNEIKLNENP
ncbi:MAG: DUF2085 domain-containing protein [Methanomassiliicoccales archaeon]|nr:DUF2085 domain-containing protein [Methanomassiliicoccales archaeon]